ncbi:c-type cytochrome [Glaciimonas sp. CA11.2]|uniref:SorB family sulfite dehydrogenase c-type cytochrome subunit n=1 Tax=unclassified Glaciimonas TaxID=2644401 RepID=UPI002AB4B8A8|nr:MULTISPECIES: c-type cytochrome [unclassified Glaciimonas]MDY7546515.1 c-type cytochrome [Glaciimonas sp. CA11.2]MEB0012906.1 c-type cytochrome [Glaciimonas sp. Cout2]MEB0080803.1 c-type cytochrome [Glaciimonas sp. Gout2]MEB0162973.1 c-type cytochrome [Glaciimonas sp. CA11.2]
MKRLVIACAGLSLVSVALLAQAAPNINTLPPETAKLTFSALPGYMIAMQKCAICHSADYVKYQPPGMTLTQWTAEVGKMQHLYGAPVTDDDVKKIGAYLAVTYGTAKESALPAELKTAAVNAPETALNPSATTPALPVGKSIDAKALLAANSCLSCHAIDQKIVGPSYHDVALKYHADPEAVSKLETSIRNGGAGKWGAIPMPAFAQLKPEELRALAEFVLKQ